jgi:choline-sulfatase
VQKLISKLALLCLILPCHFGILRARPDPGPQLARTPVILITVDTLRADRLGCYGAKNVRTPAMDQLAADGVRFSDALSQVPITLPSHAVILTGTYPMYNGVRDFTSTGLPANIGLISEAFKRHGYLTAAFVSAFVLGRTWGFDRGFDTYDDQFEAWQYTTRNPGEIRRPGNVTVDHILTWIKTHRQATLGKPFFIWVHLYDPHSPYNSPEPFHTRYASRPYDGAVAYTDSQLRRLFSFLKRQGIYGRALIVLLSDHGESLGEHGEAEHGFFIYRSTLHVPLIFKLPAGREHGRVVSEPVGSVDVTPTLLDLVRLRDPLQRQFQGVSLASAIFGKATGRAAPVYSETYYPFNSFGWSPLRSASSGVFQYIQAPRPELYNLQRDPSENHNLDAAEGAQAAALESQLQSLERRYGNSPARPARQGPALSESTVEKLKSLGYVAYSVAGPPPSSARLADPKDKIRIYNLILRAEDLSGARRYDQSNRLLDRISSQEPGLYLVPFMRAENAMQVRDWAEAEKAFKAALQLNPNFQQAIMGLGRSYLNSGDASSAKPWFELAIHNNPRDFLAYYGLGLVALAGRDVGSARAAFAKSVEINPDYAPSQKELGVLLVEMRQYPQALQPLEKAEKMGLEDAELYNYSGIALENTNHLAEAVEQFRKALALKPAYAAARLNLAFGWLKMGDTAAARREFRQVCQQDSRLCAQYRSRFP